jgi:cytochrome P450
MLRDEAVYPDPDAFTPERHLGPHAQPDPLPFVFGFGRRVCPGMHFGQLQLFLNVCAILAVFEISKALDAQGREVEPRVAWKTSLVT